MTSFSVLENKISSIQKYLAFLRKHSKNNLEDIEKNDLLRGAIERYLYLLVQATIDLGEAVIALKKFRKPSTYSESFEILHEEGIIDTSLREKLIRMAKFRNIIAHDYEKIDFRIVFEVLKNQLSDVEIFIGLVQQKMQNG